MFPIYYSAQPAIDIIMNYVYDQGNYSIKAIIFDVFIAASFITMFLSLHLEEQRKKMENQNKIEYEQDIFNEESNTIIKTEHPNDLMLSKLFKKK